MHLTILLILVSIFSLNGCIQGIDIKIKKSELIACLNADALTSSYAGGDGSTANPYLICSSSQLVYLMQNSADWTKNFKLTDDIDLSSENSLAPIGTYEITGTTVNVNTPFTGIFDGGNYTISNLVIDQNTNYLRSAGLFGNATGATIKNLKITDSSVTASSHGALLVGYGLNTNVENINITNSSIISVYSAGANNNINGGLFGEMAYNDGLTHTLKNLTLNVTGTGFDTHGGLGGRINISASSTLNVTDNDITSQMTTPTTTSNANTFSGFIAYIANTSSTVTVNKNYVNSTLNLNYNGSFSSGLIGTINCTTCQYNFTNNVVEVNHQLPISFGAGIYGGFYGTGSVSSGSTITITNNSVKGNVLIKGSTSGRTTIGGFIGNLTANSGGVATVRKNYTQVNLTIVPTGTTYVGGFAGRLVGTGTLNFDNNYAVGSHTVNSPGATHGGLVGSLSGTLVTSSKKSFYSSDDYSVGIGDATNANFLSLSRSQMGVDSNFTGWDFVNDWVMGTTYPALR
jgi:hypothetical protein